MKDIKDIKISINQLVYEYPNSTSSTSSTNSTRIVNWLTGKMVELGERKEGRKK